VCEAIAGHGEELLAMSGKSWLTAAVLLAAAAAVGNVASLLHYSSSSAFCCCLSIGHRLTATRFPLAFFCVRCARKKKPVSVSQGRSK